MATNYGLLNNIATGLREGLVTYQTISNMKNQQRQNELLMKMQMQEKGLIQAQDPATGETVLQRDPEFMRRQLQNKISEAATEGKILEINPEGTGLVFKGYSPEFIQAQREIYGAKNPFGLVSPGQKAADVAFGKDYADYQAGGGKAAVEKSLEQLSGATKELAAEDKISGGLTGYMPEFVQDITNPKLARVRDDIRSAIQSTLRQVLGPQFTEREGTAIFERAFNPRLSDEENFRRATAELNALKEMAKNKDAAAKYYEENGTLEGFKASRRGLIEESKAPKVGDIVDGYEFLGGDPANEKSWRKK